RSPVTTSALRTSSRAGRAWRALAPHRGRARALSGRDPRPMSGPGPRVLVTTVAHRPPPTHTAVSEPKQSVHNPRVGCPDVETFVIRLWLPDRPGALGQVASRIGA